MCSRLVPCDDDEQGDDEPHLEFLHPREIFLIQTSHLIFAHHTPSHLSRDDIPLAQDLESQSSPSPMEHLHLLLQFQCLTGIVIPASLI